MKRLSEFLSEATDPAAQAKSLGLQYVGFGRYEDPHTQQVTHIVQDGKLVPFNKAVRTNTYVAQSGNDFGNLAKQLKPIVGQDMMDLNKAYQPTKYTNDELSALKSYTDANYASVNAVLNSLPTGIKADKIQPLTPDDHTPELVKSLDSALHKSKTPKDVTAYSIVSDNLSTDHLTPGSIVKFKGFRSTTLNIETAISQVDPTHGGGTLFQMHIPKGSKGMLADNFSSTPGQGEFILPRGSKVKVVSGPTKMVGTYQSPDNTLDMYIYNCEVDTQ